MTRNPHTTRRYLAALLIALSLTTLGATTVAAADPGMTHNGTEMTHN